MNSRYFMAMLGLAMLAGCTDEVDIGAGNTGAASVIAPRVTGLMPGNSITLQNNFSDDLVVAADGDYVFAIQPPRGAIFSLTLAAQPPHQTCSIKPAAGRLRTASTPVSVECVTDRHDLGGTVTGLASTKSVILTNGTTSVTVNKNGSFKFPGGADYGSRYDVYSSKDPALQECVVTGGAGVMTEAGVADIAVNCIPAPAAPVLLTIAPDVAVKRYKIAFSPVAGATHYILQNDMDGTAGPRKFEQVGEPIVATSSSTLQAPFNVALHLEDWANSRYRIRACDATACGSSEPIPIASARRAVSYSGTSVTVGFGYAKASDSTSSKNLGRVVALAGDGQSFAAADTSTFESSAAVYVFLRDPITGVWQEQKKFNDKAELLALSETGDRLFLLASSWNSPAVQARCPGKDWGVRILNKVDGVWGYGGVICAAGTSAIPSKMLSSADGKTLVLGIPDESSGGTAISPAAQFDGGAKPDSGAVLVLREDLSGWSVEAHIKAHNADEGDRFGESIAVTSPGHVIVVGAPYEDSGNAENPADNLYSNAGAAYVYSRSAGVWTLKQFLKADTVDREDRFGSAVALSDTTRLRLAVGAPGEDSQASSTGTGIESNNDAPDTGALLVYERGDDLVWSKVAFLKPAQSFVPWSNGVDAAEFGEQVMIGGGVIVAPDRGVYMSYLPYTPGERDFRWRQSFVVPPYLGTDWQGVTVGTGIPETRTAAMSYDGQTLIIGAYTESGDLFNQVTQLLTGLLPGSGAHTGSGAVLLF